MKLALVSPFPLWPIRCGAARRTMALAHHLLGEGHSISLICPRGEARLSPSQTPFDWTFFRKGHRVLHLLHPALFFALLRACAGGCQGIVLSFPYQILPILYVSKLKGIPFYLDEHNVEYARLASLKKTIASAAVLLLESLAARHAQDIFAVSEHDQSVFERRFGRRPRLVPNGVDTRIFTPHRSNAKPSSVLFFGDMAYGPNRQAAHFIHQILAPALASCNPRIRLTIAGPHCPHLEPQPNVQILGAAENIEDVIAATGLVIAPLDARDGGGGTRLKILEAMACGKNVLATAAAAHGLPAHVQAAIRIATLENFAGEIARFFDGQWEIDYAQAARQAAESLDWSHCLKDLALA